MDPSNIVFDENFGLPLVTACTDVTPGEEMLGPSPVRDLISFSSAVFSYPEGDPRCTYGRAFMARNVRGVEDLGFGHAARLTQPAIGSGVIRGDLEGDQAIGVARLVPLRKPRSNPCGRVS